MDLFSIKFKHIPAVNRLENVNNERNRSIYVVALITLYLVEKAFDKIK